MFCFFFNLKPSEYFQKPQQGDYTFIFCANNRDTTCTPIIYITIYKKKKKKL